MEKFTPYGTLRNRTFLGLIVAQFLAAFNDQCIHAAAMFYAIRTRALSEEAAITLMPILFYAPWAIFCTLAGYFADRYSKRQSLVFWKLAEVAITLVALLGFWVGKPGGGPWIVLSTVFLMGLHSAFFVPAKYGAMPEILQPSMLSKGNGVLESTSFLAVILGTVSGGVLSHFFNGAKSPMGFVKHEYYIGLVLVVLAAIGAVVSLTIGRMPAANPTRPFPWNLFAPLARNVRTLLRSRPLALAVLGIAFFTFMVAYMRATVYMHGESHHWNEFETSLVVATVGLGIGLGSPLAGYFSGGKVELGLVPLGAVGMALATLLAGLVIPWPVGWLVGSIIGIGFFAGFYIVPLYTLLQHRAPKTSKGDLIATSNFINVTGAIIASVLFFGLVFAGKLAGLTEKVPQTELAKGTLVTDVPELRGEVIDIKTNAQGFPVAFVVQPPGKARPLLIELRPPGSLVGTTPAGGTDEPASEEDTELIPRGRGRQMIEVDEPLQKGTLVAVGTYTLRSVTHFRIQPSPAGNQPLEAVDDMERLPPYLFIGASVMTLGILVLLCRQLPDFFIRSLLWMRSYGRYHIKVTGGNLLPSEGPAILATNCHRVRDSMHVLACTDRTVRFLLIEDPQSDERRPFLRFLAKQTGMVILKSGEVAPKDFDLAVIAGTESLHQGHLVAVSADGTARYPELERLLAELREVALVPIVPVFYGWLDGSKSSASLNLRQPRRVRVVIGEALPPQATIAEIRRAIEELGKAAHEGTVAESD